MSERDEQAYVLHMLECVAILEECVQKGQKAFETDMIIRGAVLRYLQEIGESSKRLSKTTKQNFPNIPWRKIADFRNVLVHEYLGIDMGTVYKVAVVELPKSKTVLLSLKEQTS